MLGALLSSAALAQTGTLDPPLILSADSRYPGHGGTTTFTITGPPNAIYRLEAADTAAETNTSFGKHFLNLTVDFVIEAGNLSAQGDVTVVVDHPAGAEFDGQLRYFQARAQDGPDQGLSNGIAVRFSDPPTGTRQPDAIAVTSDGAIAIVAHEKDGTVSVIDATTDTLLFDMPVSIVPPSIGWPLQVAIDPDDRHAFVIDSRLRTIPVIHIDSGSIAGQIPVPGGSRSMAFSFGSKRKVYVTNERDQEVLAFTEAPFGKFIQRNSTPLLGSGPGPVQPLPGRQVIVGNRASLDVEIADTTTSSRIPLGSPPIDIVVDGNTAWVPTFTQLPSGPDGKHEVLEIDLDTRQIVGAHLVDLATDYLDLLLTSQHMIIVGSGSGTVVIVDRNDLSVLDTIDLNPGGRTTVPPTAAIVPDPTTGEPNKLYVVNQFRETIRPIDLSGGPPFPLLPEIALAYSGQPRVPLVDLTDVENGEWLFSSVEFLNGTATNPNLVTCATCHPHGFSDAVNSPNGLQAQPLFDAGTTAPYAHAGSRATLHDFTQAAFNKHGTLPGSIDPTFHLLVDLFQEVGVPVPVSPYLEADGSLSLAAQAGQLVFEGVANCSSCHTAPIFIPEDPDPKTIPEGVGTGLAPANVPSLRGLWASAPYLANGLAPNLIDVLLLNVTDEHGTTSTLTQQELDDLVAYLESL